MYHTLPRVVWDGFLFIGGHAGVRIGNIPKGNSILLGVLSLTTMLGSNKPTGGDHSKGRAGGPFGSSISSGRRLAGEKVMGQRDHGSTPAQGTQVHRILMAP